MRRHLIAAALPGDLPREWTHRETSASIGSQPILFRFFRLAVAQATNRLGLDMGEGARLPIRA